MEYDSAILEHYAREAAEHGDCPTSTMADEITRAKETTAILDSVWTFLPQHGAGPVHIVDVGCGNGYTLNVLAQKSAAMPQRQCRYTGLEFTPELREIASRNARPEVTILPGDVRKPLQCEPADVLVCQRVLINLLDPADQRRALGNIVAALKPGGLLIAIEAFASGLERLNEARAEFGLAPIPQAHHNLYLPDDFFDHPMLHKWGEMYRSPRNFLSTHYFVTRVLHDIALAATGSQFRRNSHFARFFSEALPDNIGDYSPLRFIARLRS